MDTTTAETSTVNHPVVSSDRWVAARKALLAREKELTHLRDQIARERRALPWERVDKRYVFDAPEGQRTLTDLFDGRRQLLRCWSRPASSPLACAAASPCTVAS